MRSRGAFLALALALAACGEDAGPIGSPGGRDGVVLSYATPQVQVRAVGAPAKVSLTLLARRAGPDDSLAPWPGAAFDVQREAGAGRLSATRVVTNQDGRATVELDTPGGADRTRVSFVLSGDRHSHLPFEVVTAPVVPVDLTRGEVAHLDPPPNGAILRFSLASEGRYALIPLNLDPKRSGVTYRFHHTGAGAGGGFTADARPRGSRPAVVVEERGDVVAGSLDPGILAPAAGIPGALNIKSCMIETNRLAPLRYAGRHVALYVDAPPDQWQARIDSLGREFDERIFPGNTALFGPTPDRDGNGVVLVVLTPALQGLSGVYCDGVRALGVEAFYAVWNPDDRIDRTLATLAHEHQHVVNAGWHFVSRGTIGDERWLNEAMSFAAEARSGYWGSPLVRVWQFLSGQNGGMTMLPFEYASPFHDEYMMFLVYLGDRFGDEFYYRLGSSGHSGERNVEESAGLPFPTLVRDWLVAAGVSGRHPDIDPRYRYTTFDLHGMAEEIAACQCIPKNRFEGMNLEPLWTDSPFDVFRSLDGYDADYYVLRGSAGRSTVDVFFDAFGIASVGLSAARLADEPE
ncbi:MAG TPA: hypothetical protein VM778_00040 [Gemmatimonadota bacterium]|nr:hypothetical protein [Gemmatimonadota bacterium]